MSRIVNILSGLITMSLLTAAITLSMLGTPNLDKEQHECLAMNIYHESRGEVIEGQMAVGHVTVNRANHPKFPSSICDVVYQPKQFSWTFTIKNKTPTDTKAWQQALVIARDVMIGNTTDPTDGATFYHANYVNPYWTDHMELSKVIGLHVFYTWDGTWDD